MPVGIDDIFISRVREANSITEIIGDYLNLKPKSRGDFWGLCPFHNEKTPSFHVHVERGIFKCFGCGRGGNVITFLMEIEGLTFIEALKILAERAGIEFPEFNTESARESRSERDRILNAMQLALSHYHGNLQSAFPLARKFDPETALHKLPENVQALLYLQERGIDAEIIERFKLGWADSGWDSLVVHARKKNVSGQVLVQAGLASPKKDGSGFVDRFRTRIIFPIFNLSGKAVAFGARRLEKVTPDSDPAKYVNSPETAIYRKGEHLYGLVTSRESIRSEHFSYLVEGYTDLLAFVRAGINNVVASLGTAATQSQARLLYRFTRRVNIVYDSDTAGINAAIRAADILTLERIETRVVKLPAGEDPDSVLRSGGADGLRKALLNELSFVAFRMTASGFDSEMGQSERVEAARGVLETIRGISDPLRCDILLAELSDKSGITREALEKALANLKPRSFQQVEKVTRLEIEVTKETKPEWELIHLLTGHQFLLPEIMRMLTPDHFFHKDFKRIFLFLEQAYLKGEILDLQSLPEQFERPELRAFITDGILDGDKTPADKAREAALECVRALKRRDMLTRTKELQLKINEASRNKLPTKDLLRELVELSQQMNAETPK